MQIYTNTHFTLENFKCSLCNFHVSAQTSCLLNDFHFKEVYFGFKVLIYWLLTATKLLPFQETLHLLLEKTFFS